MTDNKLPLTNINTWIRFAYMVLFTVLLMAARLVISLVVIVQFALVLLTGNDNENLLSWPGAGQVGVSDADVFNLQY